MYMISVFVYCLNDGPLFTGSETRLAGKITFFSGRTGGGTVVVVGAGPHRSPTTLPSSTTGTTVHPWCSSVQVSETSVITTSILV